MSAPSAIRNAFERLRPRIYARLVKRDGKVCALCQWSPMDPKRATLLHAALAEAGCPPTPMTHPFAYAIAIPLRHALKLTQGCRGASPEPCILTGTCRSTEDGRDPCPTHRPNAELGTWPIDRVTAANAVLLANALD